MRKIIYFILITWPYIDLFAQIEPIQSSDEKLKALSVKTVSTYHYSIADASTTNRKLVLKKEISQDGRLMKKYLLSLWDDVSYSHTSTFQYNENGQLVEELKIQKILNLFKRDEDYIQSFGDKPLNEKILYFYNNQGKLSEKLLYTFTGLNLPDSVGPNQTIIYKYENDHLLSEKSTSPESRIFNHNYAISYKYDSLGNIAKRTRSYGKDLKMVRTTSFKYNSENRIEEEKTIDLSAPHNNYHYKYEYDSAGHLINKYAFSEEEEIFELEISYKYDDHGNQISGIRSIEFEYYENGLIKTESWVAEKTDERIHFITEYEFY